jgi:poly-beta-1,6-N-acetyl-D-glucosamine synthase
MTYILLTLIFWGSVGLILYTYVFYPLILYVLYRLKGSVPARVSSYRPTVSLLISAYNEEKVIEEKLNNVLKIDYPKEKFVVLVGLDGCSDNTHAIIKKFENSIVRAIAFKERRGKAAVLNDLVDRAESEVLVFSDANTLYEPTAITNMVRHFDDPEIGGVCGKLELHAHNKNAGSIGESMYWQYENMLKLMEGTIHTTIGATGAIYAIRKSLYKVLPTDKIVTDDFLIPLGVVARGTRVIYEQDAIAYEKTTENIKQEFSRKVRIGVANFVGLAEIKHLLFRKLNFVTFALWSHKLIRWLVPFLLCFLLLSNLMLVVTGGSIVYSVLLLLQGVFYSIAGIGFVLDHFKIYSGLLGYPYFFVSMNWALMLGFFRYILNRKKPTWQVMR